MSPGCERGRHAPERAVKYNHDLFYRKRSPVRKKVVKGCESAGSDCSCGSARVYSMLDFEDGGSVNGYRSSPESVGEEDDMAASVVTAVRVSGGSLGGSAAGKVDGD